MKISSMEMDRLVESGEKVEKQIQEAVSAERERTIKEVTEQLTQTHKREIEMLRQRFKLMACTNAERCPSETNLERIEVLFQFVKLKFEDDWSRTMKTSIGH